jgi:hypothetical protein
MDGKTITLVLLVGMLLPLPAFALETINLEDEELYCDHYGISMWCPIGGVEFLSNLTPEQLNYYRYFNDYAFSDEVRYSGQLRVKNIEVYADLTTTSNVEAVYKIQNPSTGETTVEISVLEVSESAEMYENGELQDVDPLVDGLDVTFAPGEEKEIKLVFEEPLYGDIFGYNVNLLFDNKTIDNHITPEGSFVFRLPRGVALEQCVPSSYTTKTETGRLTVSWQKTDFIPWTNPFNDLICKWNVGEAAPATGASEQPAGDSGWVVWAVLVILILGGVFWLYRSGRLEDLLNR